MTYKSMSTRNGMFNPNCALGNALHKKLATTLKRAQTAQRPDPVSKGDVWIRSVKDGAINAASWGNRAFGLVDALTVGSGVGNYMDDQATDGTLTPVLDAGIEIVYGQIKCLEKPFGFYGGLAGGLVGSMVGAFLGPITQYWGLTSQGWRSRGAQAGTAVGVGIVRAVGMGPFTLTQQILRLITGVVKFTWLGLSTALGAAVGAGTGTYAAYRWQVPASPDCESLLGDSLHSHVTTQQVRTRWWGKQVALPRLDIA